MRSKETIEDIDRAALLLCDELERAQRLRIGGAEMTGRYAAERARKAPLKRRRMAGRRLLAQYRRQTNCPGAIDWESFRAWLKEHMAELTFAKVILSIITVLLML